MLYCIEQILNLFVPMPHHDHYLRMTHPIFVVSCYNCRVLHPLYKYTVNEIKIHCVVKYL